MKIHVNQIPAGGLHLEGEEEGDILGLQAEGIRCAGPVRYCVDAGLSDGGLFVTGALDAAVELECVSCLQRFTYPVHVGDFAVQIELGSRELIDLTENVREDMVLALPPHPHCNWDGKNSCPGVRSMASPTRGARAEAGEENPWKTLDKLAKPKD